MYGLRIIMIQSIDQQLLGRIYKVLAVSPMHLSSDFSPSVTQNVTSSL
jgi:hypothetical protein